MARAAQQFRLVAERLIVFGPTAITVFTRVARFTRAPSITFACSVALALAIAKAGRARVTVRTVKPVRTANGRLLHAQPQMQIGMGRLMILPPHLDLRFIVFGQLVALVLPAYYILA